MYGKLALRNIRRSARDSFIYFVTLTMTSALMFAFNSLLFSDDITELYHRMEQLGSLFPAASLFVALIVGWLIHYMTNFLILQRSREFGLYLLLGMERKHVSRMFLAENVGFGTAALLCGTGLGVLLFQALTAIVMHVFEAPYRIAISFSPAAFGLTAFYIALIYLFVFWRNNRTISKLQVHDLLYAANQNETRRIKTKRGAVFAMAAALAAAAVGFGLLKIKSTSSYSIILAFVLFVAAIYAFYLSVGACIALLGERLRQRNYKGMRLFLLRQTTAKINTTSVVMGTIAMLITFALLSTGGGMLLVSSVNTQIENHTAFDIIMFDNYNDTYEYNDPPHYAQQLDYIRARAEVTAEIPYYLYETGNDQVLSIYKKSLKGADLRGTTSDLCIRLSDYNALRAQRGMEPVALAADEVAVHTEKPRLAAPLRQQMQHDNGYAIQGKAYRMTAVYEGAFAQVEWNGNGYFVIVPDDAVTGLVIVLSNMVVTTRDGFPVDYADEIYERSENALVVCRSNQIAQSRSAYTIFSFLLFYIGLVFILIAATVLAIQQLSDSGKYRYRFDVLRKLGVGERGVRRLVLKQLAAYFGLPFVLPLLVCTGFGWYAAVNFANMIPSVWTAPLCILATIAIFLAVYLCYFAVTFTGVMRNIEKNRPF